MNITGTIMNKNGMKKLPDKYWEGFADGAEFANRLWGETSADEMFLKDIIGEHIERIRGINKGERDE